MNWLQSTACTRDCVCTHLCACVCGVGGGGGGGGARGGGGNGVRWKIFVLQGSHFLCCL